MLHDLISIINKPAQLAIVLSSVLATIALAVYLFGSYPEAALRRRKLRRLLWKTPLDSILPVGLSVNIHFLRQCNYQCKFCFHTDKGREVGVTELKLPEFKRGLKMLAEAGATKINFSGGEPFLKAKLLGEMCHYAKRLGIESVGVVSNGSLITEAWMKTYGRYLDVLAVSCDSFDDPSNVRIGRRSKKSGQRSQSDIMRSVAKLCRKYRVMFKMNTVVCSENVDEDMSAALAEVEPARWKVFQVLPIEGENTGDNPTDRCVEQLLITHEQFHEFVKRHEARLPAHIPVIHEDNDTMRNSYLILDERLRFLNNTNNTKEPTESILTAGVEGPLRDAGFDRDAFLRRDGDCVRTGSTFSESQAVQRQKKKSPTPVDLSW